MIDNIINFKFLFFNRFIVIPENSFDSEEDASDDDNDQQEQEQK